MEGKNFNITQAQPALPANPAFNISELFSLAFGYGTQQIPVVYKTQDTRATGGGSRSGIHFDLPVIESAQEALELTNLGTPILFPITFVGKGYQQYDKQGIIAQVQMPDFRLPASTICEFSRSKALTTTALSGGVGTVKEMFGFEDWTLSIKGICFTEPNHPQAKTALEQKSLLYKWDQLADSIQVEAQLFRELDIFNVVTGRIKFSQIPGKPEFIPFEFEATSDQPAELLGL